jgi:outer membrane protein
MLTLSAFRGVVLSLAVLFQLVVWPSHAEEAPPVYAWKPNDIVLRGRVFRLLTHENGSVPVHGGTPTVSNETGGELSLSWFLNPFLSLELGVAGSLHQTGIRGTRPVIESLIGPITLPRRDISLGDVGIIAPMLSANLHPLPQSRLSPYVGIGVGYAVFISDGERIDYRNSIFPLLRAGVDVHLTDQLALNLDVRRLLLSTDVKGAFRGRPVTAEIEVDQWAIGLGMTFRF